MSYNVIQIDPRPANKEAMIELLKANAPVWGIEFTLPALAQYIEFNIDGQHVDGGNGKAAIELAVTVDLPPENTTFAVVRADPDALGAIAVFNLRKEDEGDEDRRLSAGLEAHMIDERHIQKRIKLIADHDKFVQGPWTGQPKELNEDQKIFKGMSAFAFDHKVSLQHRVNMFEKLICEGTYNAFQYYENKSLEELEMARKESRVRENDGVSIVESRHIGATTIGYEQAPVVVIRNDDFRFQGGEPHIKYTICQWKEGYVNFDVLKVKLNDLEQCGGTWGGSKTILGSPQGVSSTLTLEQVEQVVRDCKIVTCNDHGMAVLQEDLNEYGNCK